MSEAPPADAPEATASDDAWLDAIAWDANGLIPAIAQEKDTGDILMVAWMNREALRQTAQKGQAVYYSRSRGKLWHKGEESGHFQTVHAIRTDCDSDVILLTITQHGHQPSIACHTGRHSCFYQRLENPASPAPHWQAADPVLKDPQRIYSK